MSKPHPELRTSFSPLNQHEILCSSTQNSWIMNSYMLQPHFALSSKIVVTICDWIKMNCSWRELLAMCSTPARGFKQTNWNACALIEDTEDTLQYDKCNLWLPFVDSKAEQESCLRLAEEISKQLHFIKAPKNPRKASMRKKPKLCLFLLTPGSSGLL